MSFLDDVLTGNNTPSEGYIEFLSSDHIRYQNGIDVSGHNYNCHRKIKIENSITQSDGYTITIFNEDSVHPIWGNKVQMSPKRMQIVKISSSCVEFRGCGTDPMGFPFSNYGLSIYHQNRKITKCVLHMFAKNVDIEYLN
mgnify:CR=1 FL=1